MKQEFIAGIVLGVIGLALALIPTGLLWRVTEKWKTKGAAQPSKSYAVLMKILGIVFAATGAALIVCNV